MPLAPEAPPNPASSNARLSGFRRLGAVNSIPMNDRTEKQLYNFLTSRWLKPEAAIFGTLKSRSLDKVTFNSPSLDISCGDGSLMFQHFGGEFEFHYDLFHETKARAFKHNAFIDIYDYDSTIIPAIARPPETTIDYGTDWKQALLNKAERLGVYKNLTLHDNNVLPLPFDQGSFATVFSTSLYWVKDIPGMLAEAHRMTQPGGQLVLTVKTPSLLNTLEKLSSILSPEAISILDRRRTDTMPGGADSAGWKRMVEDVGFTVEHMESVFPTQFLMDIWNVGVRPVSHLLIQMAEEMTPERRLEIKKEWVDIFYELLKPLVSLPNTCPIESAPYLLIVARR